MFSLDARIWSAVDLRSAKGQKALQLAKLHKLAVACQCDATCVLPMAVKQRGEGRYFLARFPDTAQDHETWCASYETPSEAVSRRTSLKGVAAIVEEGGQFHVNLREPLGEAKPTEETAGAFPPHGHGKGEYQSATSLAALSLFLLEQGGLIAQRLGDEIANWSGAAARIADKVLPKTVIRGQLATSVLLLPRLRNSETIKQMVIDLRTAWSRTNKPYRLVFGRILGVRDHDDDHVAVRLEYTRFEVIMLKTSWQAWIARSVSANAGAAVNSLHDPDGDTRLLFMALVKPGKKFNQLSALTAALVVTNRTFMHVASQPELAVANRLFAGSGHIDKPMRPRLDCLPYVPDFVLSRQDEPTLFMEVAGLNDVQYLEHLKVKINAYAKKGLSIWVWFVDAELMPPFIAQTLTSVLARLDALLDDARLREAKKAASGSDGEAA